MPKKNKNKTSRAGNKPVPALNTTLKGCEGCPAICCHDLSITILRPRTRADIDDLKWQLNYRTVGVYIRNRRWHLIVEGPCQYLGQDSLCTRYEDRFDICRDHKPPLCERYDEWYDVLFTDPDELEAYLRAQRRGETPPLPTGKWSSKGAGPKICK